LGKQLSSGHCHTCREPLLDSESRISFTEHLSVHLDSCWLALMHSTGSSSQLRPHPPTTPLDLFCVRRTMILDGIVRQSIHCCKCEADTRRAWIPRPVHILPAFCFKSCAFFASISFESDSRLKRIESSAFSDSSLRSIVIPRSVEILCSSCFEECKSLSSILFESNSALKRIESHAF
jgi:hypothetical protein